MTAKPARAASATQAVREPERHPPIVDNPLGHNKPPGAFGYGIDEARYIVGLSRFVRPRISIPGKAFFEWPLGTEGCRLFGDAKLAIHRYIGDNEAVVEVMHRDESRIEMTGIFPGSTGTANMLDLHDLLVQVAPDDGLILTLPKIFPKTQLVVMENYDFTRPENDRGGNWTYSVTFVRTGVGKKVPGTRTIPPPGNPITIHIPKGSQLTGHAGKVGKGIRTNEVMKTVRGIAKKVHGAANLSSTLVNNNRDVFERLSEREGKPFFNTVIDVIPPGTKIRVGKP